MRNPTYPMRGRRMTGQADGRADAAPARDLKAQIEDLAALPVDELLEQLDPLLAGEDFSRLMDCTRGLDFHIHSETGDTPMVLLDGRFAFDSDREDSDLAEIAGYTSRKEFEGENFSSGKKREMEVLDIHGVISRYSELRGAGLVRPDDQSLDVGRAGVFLSATCLYAHGYRTAHEGARIHCLALKSPRRTEAFRVHYLDQGGACARPDGASPPDVRVWPGRDGSVLVQPTATAGRPADDGWDDGRDDDWRTVSVMWFDEARGIGILTSDADPPGVIVRTSTLARFGLSVLRPGQRLRVRCSDGGSRREVTEIAIVSGPETDGGSAPGAGSGSGLGPGPATPRRDGGTAGP